MSLIMSLETYEGIVMTADRLSTLSYYNEISQTTDAFPKTYNAQKLFLMRNGYGLSCCGDSKVSNDMLVEQFISEEICSKDYGNILPKDIAIEILNIFKTFNINIILLFCGYYQGHSFIIEINSNLDEPYSYSENVRRGAVIRYGDTKITDSVLGKNKEGKEEYHYGYQTYRLQDVINLLSFTNLVTAKYQQFQEVLQTVSEECDILVLFKNGEHKWIRKNELSVTFPW